jgi:hypothetical protein
MFGLTKREQRWAAEERAFKILATLAAAVVESDAKAKERDDENELARLRAEVAALRAKIEGEPHG